MKFNYKKIASIFASAVMLSSTVGFAAAAAYPMPFVNGGVADGAVVVGTAADVRDWTAGMSVQADLNTGVAGSAGESVLTGTAWKVSTSSDNLELGEAINSVESYIGDEDLPVLGNGEISNEKGTAKYEQFLYFDDPTSQVDYQQDDDDNIGLMFKVVSGQSFARYVMDFTTNLKSDITSADVLEDIEDEEITIIGKAYTITKAINTTTGTQLTLMSGADKTTVANGEEIVVGGKAVSVTVTATNSAEFTVDGESTNAMDKGDTYKLNDGTYLGVAKITYQNFAGGIMQASFYLGADKIQMNNGSAIEVNAETIDDAVATISETISGGDISISEISVNMTAEDDLYVPIDGKLSEADDLDEPQALLTQNWDIEFKGLETVDTEDMKLQPTASDKKYQLTMTNSDGNTFDIPLFYTNNSGIYPGLKASEELRLVNNITNSSLAGLFAIDKGDYFILNTADPKVPGNNAKSFLVQYKGSDKVTASSPVGKFDVKGVGEKEASINTGGNMTLKLGGSEFAFDNMSTGTSDNFKIALNGVGYYDGDATGQGPWEANGSVSMYLRTKNNALVNITDTGITNIADGLGSEFDSAFMYLNVTVDDANKDGDDVTLAQASSQAIFTAKFNHSQDADASATVTDNGAWISDPDNSDITTYRTQYGADITATDPDSAPVTIELTIPETVVEPLVYVSSGDITVSTGSTGTGGQVLFVKDSASDVASVEDKNLLVVGGSCINKVAAKILGSDTPLCDAAFTAKTNVGAGQYIIKTVESPYNAEKIAMLVAGYAAADTENAVATAKDGASSEIGEQVYPMVTA